VRHFEPDYPGSRNPWDSVKHPENYEYIQNIIEHVDKHIIRPPKYTEETKLEVYRLRDQGYTLRQIADTVGVSKITACLYIQKKRKLDIQRAMVKQPGTDKLVEAEYSVNTVNIGKISPKRKAEQKLLFLDSSEPSKAQ